MIGYRNKRRTAATSQRATPVGLVAAMLWLVLAAAPATVHAQHSALEPDYRLSSGDRVRVTVFGHDNLSGEFMIDGAGRISLPLIQVIDAGGLSTEELAGVISEKFKPDYLKNPRVSVDIVGYRPFYILGEVRNPGAYPFVNDMTVVTAVALAGGYSYRAAKKKITVIRGDDPEKKKQRIKEDTRIMPGDLVEVPERFF
jgi:polysaccharide export outer membrane protein